jgi:hypothetical protein
VTVGVAAVTVVAEMPTQAQALVYLTTPEQAVAYVGIVAGRADGVDVVCGTEDAVTVLMLFRISHELLLEDELNLHSSWCRCLHQELGTISYCWLCWCEKCSQAVVLTAG